MTKTNKGNQYDRERAILNYGILVACNLINSGHSVDELSKSTLEKIKRMNYILDMSELALFSDEGVQI